MAAQTFWQWSDDIKPKDDITPFDGIYIFNFADPVGSLHTYDYLWDIYIGKNALCGRKSKFISTNLYNTLILFNLPQRCFWLAQMERQTKAQTAAPVADQT
jgi:hypothetical protein